MLLKALWGTSGWRKMQRFISFSWGDVQGRGGKCNPISQTRLKFALEMEKESESFLLLSISLTERLTLPDPPSSHLYTQVYTMTYLCHSLVSIQAANVPAIWQHLSQDMGPNILTSLLPVVAICIVTIVKLQAEFGSFRQCCLTRMGL